MAENKTGVAQNKLGELFVDFGSSGLGGLIKGLRTISADFLLGKNAAQQFIKPITGMSKNAAETVTGFAKLNSVTGISIGQLQELQVWAKLNSVSFGEMMGQVQNLQQQILNGFLGKGWNEGFFTLGIDPRSLDYTKPLDALDKIKSRILQLDEATGALGLTQLGLSQDLQFAFRQNNEQFDRRLLLNQKEIQSLNQQQQSWNSLSATWQAGQQKFIANQTWINTLLGNTQTFLENSAPIVKNINDSMNWLYDKALPKLGEFIAFFTTNKKDPVKRWNGSAFNAKPGSYQKYEELWANNPANPKNYPKQINKSASRPSLTASHGTKAPINSPFGLEPLNIPNSGVPTNLPPLPSSITNNVTINQDIKSTDPVAAGEEAYQRFNNLELNTAQYQNQSGI